MKLMQLLVVSLILTPQSPPPPKNVTSFTKSVMMMNFSYRNLLNLWMLDRFVKIHLKDLRFPSFDDELQMISSSILLL